MHTNEKQSQAESGTADRRALDVLGLAAENDDGGESFLLLLR